MEPPYYNWLWLASKLPLGGSDLPNLVAYRNLVFIFSNSRTPENIISKRKQYRIYKKAKGVNDKGSTWQMDKKPFA
jgi:hypothetical protein